ncbi:hypothetical protein [Bradyrhizobium sp.]|jgi:hypothetical protein|uniref:hypothetical protein n=1 Tax=Bradyrhizobium sp. TaxID=376 RepID=UPI002DDD65C3|nr:hypothetical protein [Bradyrhizobium sp.]HEV2158348.1 hypothetical protein [Bradyrhizobium sp.]
MAYPRINVRNIPGNHENWGKLVKTWSTGKNYVRHVITEQNPFPTVVEPKPEFPRPTTFRDFVAQAQSAGVQLFFDDGVNNPDVTGDEDLYFEMTYVELNTHYVKLPHSVRIAESEARLQQNGNRYFLPGFYDRIEGHPPLAEQTSSQVQKAKLHAERVGEYTINTCG